jgi:hypothetical protein
VPRSKKLTAQELGRLLVGYRNRKLSAKRRREIALKAAAASLKARAKLSAKQRSANATKASAAAAAVRAKLPASRRTELARRAAKARWAKRKPLK